jgi:hypothetical protein
MAEESGAASAQAGHDEIRGQALAHGRCSAGLDGRAVLLHRFDQRYVPTQHFVDKLRDFHAL